MTKYISDEAFDKKWHNLLFSTSESNRTAAITACRNRYGPMVLKQFTRQRESDLHMYEEALDIALMELSQSNPGYDYNIRYRILKRFNLLVKNMRRSRARHAKKEHSLNQNFAKESETRVLSSNTLIKVSSHIFARATAIILFRHPSWKASLDAYRKQLETGESYRIVAPSFGLPSNDNARKTHEYRVKQFLKLMSSIVDRPSFVNHTGATKSDCKLHTET